VHANVLDAAVAGPRVVDGEVAFSNAATNTKGLDAGINNEMSVAVVPPAGTTGAPVNSAGKNAYGKGAALSVGLGGDIPVVVNDLNLTESGAASAPPTRSDGKPAPNTASTGLVTKNLVEVPGAPLAYANALKSSAGAVWSKDTCPIGQPIAYGQGSAADAQLVEAGTHAAGSPKLVGPLVSTDSTDGQDVSDSQSFTYLVPNKNADGTPDGTYGVASETQMILAPVTIAENAATGQGALTIQVGGTWFLRVTVSGKAGSTPLVEYGKAGVTDPTTKVLEVLSNGASQGMLTTQDLFKTGLQTPDSLKPLLQLSVGEAPRAWQKGDVVQSPPVKPALTATSAAVAVDVARVGLLQPNAPAPAPKVADVRVGHMETKISVPAGGFKCTFPVTKVGSSQVTTNADTTWEITIPSDAAALDAIACDIKGIDAVDHVETVSGTPNVVFSSADAGGKVAAGGKSVSWTNLAYKRGDPPLKLHVTGKATAPGTFKNIVDATATLTNCKGGGFLEGSALQAFLIGANLTGNNAVVGGAQIKGSGTTAQPTTAVLGQRLLPTTGGTTRLLTGMGIVALLSAAGVYLFNRRVRHHTT
jgi:LPXTG-motif cell wall-anchored protein